jgi:hypothetical protein
MNEYMGDGHSIVEGNDNAGERPMLEAVKLFGIGVGVCVGIELFRRLVIVVWKILYTICFLSFSVLCQILRGD